MSQPDWEIIIAHCDDCQRQYIDRDGWWFVWLRADGCVELKQARNVPYSAEHGWPWAARKHPALDEAVHICEVDEWIELLRGIEQLQQARGIDTASAVEGHAPGAHCCTCSECPLKEIIEIASSLEEEMRMHDRAVADDLKKIVQLCQPFKAIGEALQRSDGDTDHPEVK